MPGTLLSQLPRNWTTSATLQPLPLPAVSSAGWTWAATTSCTGRRTSAPNPVEPGHCPRVSPARQLRPRGIKAFAENPGRLHLEGERPAPRPACKSRFGGKGFSGRKYFLRLACAPTIPASLPPPPESWQTCGRRVYDQDAMTDCWIACCPGRMTMLAPDATETTSGANALPAR